MTTKTKSYGFVAVQFGLLAAIVLSPGLQTSKIWQVSGLALMIIGLAVCLVSIWQLRNYSLTALPTPLKNAKLLDSGFYALARHPIYSGLLILMTGVVMARYSWLRLGLLCALYIVLYQKSGFEEAQLTKMFGRRYKDYQQKVRRFM